MWDNEGIGTQAKSPNSKSTSLALLLFRPPLWEGRGWGKLSWWLWKYLTVVAQIQKLFLLLALFSVLRSSYHYSDLFVAWPLILWVFLSLCLAQEFGPCCLTSGKARWGCPGIRAPPEGMRTTLPSCPCAEAPHLPSLVLSRLGALSRGAHISTEENKWAPGAGHWDDIISVLDCIPVSTCPFSPSPSCRSLFPSQGQFAEH